MVACTLFSSGEGRVDPVWNPGIGGRSILCSVPLGNIGDPGKLCTRVLRSETEEDPYADNQFLPALFLQ